jgi:ABC-type multidrug transport system ATPase subunit
MDDRGISGGQLKRVSIAIEIISLPILLYLDEPTTGLDSFTSMEVMSAVRNMTNMNQAVTLCTIHQPSTELFELFDRLLLLANGRLLYFGPTSGAIDYFMSCPWGFDYQVTSNPADFIISIATESKTKSGSLSELLDYYKTTDLYESNKTFITNLTTAEASSSITTMMKPKVYPVATVTSFRHQLRILLSRRLLILYKRPMFVLSHLIK